MHVVIIAACMLNEKSSVWFTAKCCIYCYQLRWEESISIQENYGIKHLWVQGAKLENQKEPLSHAIFVLSCCKTKYASVQGQQIKTTLGSLRKHRKIENVNHLANCWTFTAHRNIKSSHFNLHCIILVLWLLNLGHEAKPVEKHSTKQL